MRPTPEELLRIIQTGVMSHMLPEVQSNYAKAQFAFSMILFTIAPRGLDTVVPDTIETNAALRALLEETSTALASIDRADARIGRDVIAALPAPSTELRLSALRAENDALRAAVASLAPMIEAATDDPALAPLREVRTKIYAHLSADARKRIVPILTV